MTIDFRNVIRRFEDLMRKGSQEEGLEYAFTSIQELDKRREYADSIQILQRILDQNIKEVLKSKINSHIIIRALLLGDTELIDGSVEKLNEFGPCSLTEIVKKIIGRQKNGSEYILDGIEKQSIFGKFEPLSEVPFMEFRDENSVYTTIEDFFTNGRYIVNLIQSSTNFHHAVNVDVGQSFDVNIVEKRRLMKID